MIPKDWGRTIPKNGIGYHKNWYRAIPIFNREIIQRIHNNTNKR